MSTGTQENDVQEATEVDLTSFEKSLKDVVKVIESLAKMYNDFSDDQQDKELAHIHTEYPYVHEMIVLLLQKWPMMPK